MNTNSTTTSSAALRIIISGGGTGGHIFPAISIANALKALRPDADILFVGAEGRMEMQRVPDAGYRISLSIAVAMLLLTLAELVYTLVVYLGGRPVDGWTTTMLVLTVGFFGLFCILAIVIKYLSLLTELVFKQQKYLVEGVEKLPTCADRAD